MKRKESLPLTGLPVPESIKTSISMPESLARFAEWEVYGFGFNSFSSYVTELVRRRKELNLLKVNPNCSVEEQAQWLAEMAGEFVTPERVAGAPTRQAGQQPRGTSKRTRPSKQ